MSTEPAARPLLALSRVSKLFSNGTLALDGLDLEVREGEILSLIGPSGCGKSTVLRIVAGLAEATAGTIEWSGDHSDRARYIGFVFQEPTLMPWATVFENVWLPLRLRGVSRAAARDSVLPALAAVELEAFAHAYPRALSGGMKMRVSIARALVMRPRLLLMDEPFAALDEITRQKLNDDLLRVHAEQRPTILFVTHSVFESVYLSSRIVVMAARPGRAVAGIGLPQNRGAGYRLSPAYAAACREVSAALHRAMGAAEAA